MKEIFFYIILIIFLIVINYPNLYHNKNINYKVNKNCNTENNLYKEIINNCENALDNYEDFILKKGKPYLWIYIDSYKTGINWPSFFGRTSINTGEDYIKLSLATVFHHCKDDFKIIILNDNNINKYLTDLNLDVGINSKLCYEKKNFYLSLRILNKYGGLWMKPSIILKPLTLIKNKIESVDFVGFACNKDVYRCNNIANYPNTDIYGSKSNTEFLKGCINDMEKIVRSFNYPSYDFLNMGRRIFTNNLDKYKEKINYYQFGTEYIGTRDYDNKVVDVSNLLSVNNTLLWKADEVLLLIIDTNGINNIAKYQWFQRMSKNQILESNLWISKLFRTSLSFNENKYFDVKNVIDNNLIYYNVDIKPKNKTDLKNVIYNSNLYFMQPWNQVFSSSSRNS